MKRQRRYIEVIRKTIEDINKKGPEFTITKVEPTFESINKLLSDFNDFYHTKFRSWRSSQRKNPLIKSIPDAGKFIVPRIVLNDETDIFPSVFAFVIRFFNGYMISVTNKWNNAMKPFAKLFSYDKLNIENYKTDLFNVPGYESRATAIIIPVKKTNNYDDYKLLTELLKTFKHYKEVDGEKVIVDANFSEVAMIKYMISELIGNVQEHVADNKVHITEMGSYYDDNFVYISFSDAGITIPTKVKEHMKKTRQVPPQKDAAALEWAFKEFTTTKRDSNGGRGLFDIKTNIINMDAELIVISRKSIGIINKSGESYIENNQNVNGTMYFLKFKQSTLGEDKVIFNTKNKKILEVFND